MKDNLRNMGENQEVEKLIYDWDNFFKDARQLAARLKDKNFKSLLVVTRGGMFLGGLLAEYLNIKTIETISLNTYSDDRVQNALIILKRANANATLNNPLVVDDISDSGVTLNYVKETIKAPIATLFYKPQSLVIPDYFVHETNRWVEFPWEVNL